MAYNVIQSAGANSGATNSSVAYGSNLSAGTKLIAWAGNSGGAGSPGISAVSDGAGHNFTQLTTFNGTDSPATVNTIWVLDTPPALVGTKPTITATAGNAANGTVLVIAEVSGLAPGTTTAACFDGTAGTGGGNQTVSGAFTPSFGSYTSHAAGELLFACYMDGGDSGATATAPGAPYTALAGNQNGQSSGNAVIVWKSSTGGSETQGTWSDTFTSGNLGYGTLFVAFKLAAPGINVQPGRPVPRTLEARRRHGLSAYVGGVPNPYQILARPATASAFTLPITTQPGDAILVDCNVANNITAVSDTQGNTYVLEQSDTTDKDFLFVATYNGTPGTPTRPLVAGVDTMTVTGSSSGVFLIAGVHNAAPYGADQNPAFNRATTSTPSGPATGTLANANEVVCSFYNAGSAGPVASWGAGFFRVMDAFGGGGASGMGALFPTSTGAVTPSATLAASAGVTGFTISLYLNPFTPAAVSQAPVVTRPALRPPPGLIQIRFLRQFSAGPATTGVSQPPIPPTSVRDTRREPKIPPPRSSETPWQGSGISQPPIPPQAVRDTRRPGRFPRPVAWHPPAPVPVAFAPPAEWGPPQKPRWLQLRLRGAFGWRQGVSQPPVPPQGLRDARRPGRLPPPRSALLPLQGSGISQPPIPPASVRDVRRPGRFPRPSAWAPPVARPGQALPGGQQPKQMPGRWVLWRWRRSAAAGPATSGVSQPPLPPSALRDGRRPWQRKGTVAAPPPTVVVVTPAAPVPGQPGQQGRRRPARFPRPWAAGPPSAGFTPPVAARSPQPGLLRRISGGLLPRRGSVRPGFEQGISQPPIPPTSVRDQRRPPRIPRSAAGWQAGVSQPPIPPASVRDVRRPPRIPRSAAGWEQGVSQPPVPPQAPARRPPVRAPRPRAAAPQPPRAGPVSPPGPRRPPPRRRLAAAFTPPTAPPVVPAVPAPRQPRAYQRLGWWRKVRGWFATPPGPTTTPPLLPDGRVAWTAAPAPPRWQATPRPDRWDTVVAPPRWQAGAGTRRWQAHALPGRWSARLANFAPIAAISLQEVNVSWTSQLRGTSVDPTGQTQGQAQLPVQYAFPVSSGNPAAPAQPVTWYTGSWLTGQTSADYISQCLVGPGGQVTLVSGQSYDVWVKITGTPEIPAIYAGTQAVY